MGSRLTALVEDRSCGAEAVEVGAGEDERDEGVDCGEGEGGDRGDSAGDGDNSSAKHDSRDLRLASTRPDSIVCGKTPPSSVSSIERLGERPLPFGDGGDSEALASSVGVMGDGADDKDEELARDEGREPIV